MFALVCHLHLTSMAPFPSPSNPGQRVALRRAQQRVFSSREESAQHSAWTETQVHDAVLRADEAGETMIRCDDPMALGSWDILEIPIKYKYIYICKIYKIPLKLMKITVKAHKSPLENARPLKLTGLMSSPWSICTAQSGTNSRRGLPHLDGPWVWIQFPSLFHASITVSCSGMTTVYFSSYPELFRGTWVIPLWSSATVGSCQRLRKFFGHGFTPGEVAEGGGSETGRNQGLRWGHLAANQLVFRPQPQRVVLKTSLFSGAGRWEHD